MATITPPTPILEPSPAMVNAASAYYAAGRRVREAIAADGVDSRSYHDAMNGLRRAWAVCDETFPWTLGWYAIEGQWWARTKVSKRGLELVVRTDLPAGLRARLARETSES